MEEKALVTITKVKREPYFEMKREHGHAYYEIYYLYSGKRKFFLKNKVFHIESGDLVIIPKGEIHRTTYYEPEEHERVALYFTEEAIRELREKIGETAFGECFLNRKISIPVNRRAYLEELFEKLMEETRGNDEFSELLSCRYCEEILLFLIRCQRHALPQETTLEVADKTIEQAAAYISGHFEEPITLEDMAQKSCMSNSYFSKRFKQVTGFGFKEYLNAVRIRHACDLLLTTDKSITVISEECGYMDSNYFGDVFRKHKHVSPRHYRKTNLL